VAPSAQSDRKVEESDESRRIVASKAGPRIDSGRSRRAGTALATMTRDLIVRHKSAPARDQTGGVKPPGSFESSAGLTGCPMR